VERSDTCAVPAAAVIGEAVVALCVADALLEKLGGDSLDELHRALRVAWRRARPLEGHVFLCGLPGAGKSTIAPLLGRALGLPVVDADATIERAAGRSVQRIFAEDGEPAFRAREAAAVAELARGPRSVIALGGGAVMTRAVRHAVRRSGSLIWLRAPQPLCVERAGSGRPLLAGDPVGKLAELARVREPVYARIADVVLDVVAQATPELLAAQAAQAVRALEAERPHV
jgi:shikimate kinase